MEDRLVYQNMTDLGPLREVLGDRLRENVLLAKYTAARIGGPADGFVIAKDADDLAYLVKQMWDTMTNYFILGGGSNILISDAGVRGVVIFNRARRVEFTMGNSYPSVWAESGANLGSIARQAALRGLSGFEWAVGIPGTLGGAVVGNAGAHGSEVADHILMAEILHHVKKIGKTYVREQWERGDFNFEYRGSKIKNDPGNVVVLSASFQMQLSSPDVVNKKIEEFTAYRQRTQPHGASMGSMFKNPPGDYAGRLIDVAGLKGTRIGDAEISNMHANFFLNHGNARADEVRDLIEMARERINEKYGIELELEIELVGDWDLKDQDAE